MITILNLLTKHKFAAYTHVLFTCTVNHTFMSGLIVLYIDVIFSVKVKILYRMSCDPRNWDMCKWSEHVNRNKVYAYK